MRKLIITSLLSLFSLNVMAEWIYFGSTSNSEQYLDLSNKKVNGNIVKVWTRQVYSDADDGIFSTKALEEFDCKNDLNRITHVVTYSDKEGTQQRYAGNSKEDWQPLLPDSIGFNILKKVCKK